MFTDDSVHNFNMPIWQRQGPLYLRQRKMVFFFFFFFLFLGRGGEVKIRKKCKEVDKK